MPVEVRPATAERFRDLRAMADELPIDDAALDRLCATVLDAEQHTVADIVSTCVVQPSNQR